MSAATPAASRSATACSAVLGVLVLGGAVAKFVQPAPVTVELMRMTSSPASAWAIADRLVLCIALFEVVVAAACLARRRFGPVHLLTAAVLVGFAAWDTARWLTDGAPDCGCFGGLKIATQWWHVGVKQVVLAVLYAGSLRSGRIQSAQLPPPRLALAG